MFLQEDSLLKLHSPRILKSVKFLESKVTEGISSSYALAITTYALALANSSVAATALKKLNEKSIQKGQYCIDITKDTLSNAM